MNKFTQLFQLIKTHKKIITIGLGIIVVLTIALTTLLQPKAPATPGEVPENIFSRINQSFAGSGFQELAESNIDDQPAFYLNTVEETNNVTGYSWSQNQILYSSPNGIFSADNNEAIINLPIQKISWNQKAQAIYQTAGQWFLFSPGQTQKPLNLTGDQAWLHPTMPYLANIQNNQLVIFSFEMKAIYQINLSQAHQIVWAADSPILAIYQDKKIILVNPLEKTQVSFDLPQNYLLNSISPNGTLLTFFDSTNQLLVGLNPQGKQIYSSEFPETRSAVAYWIDNNSLMVITTSFPDSLGRSIDYIWIVNQAGEKRFLADSTPITNRLNPRVQIFLNSDKNTIALAENQGNLWILSLEANNLPNYFEEKIHMFPLPAYQGTEL